MSYQKIVNDVLVRIENRIMGCNYEFKIQATFEDGDEFDVADMNVTICEPLTRVFTFGKKEEVSETEKELLEFFEDFACQTKNRHRFLHEKQIDLIFDFNRVDDVCEMVFS